MSQKIAKNRLFWENKHTFLSKNRSITDTSNTAMCDVYTIYVICNTSRLFLSLPRFYRHTREFVRKKSVNLAKNRLFEKKSTEKSVEKQKNRCENCEKSAVTNYINVLRYIVLRVFVHADFFSLYHSLIQKIIKNIH